MDAASLTEPWHSWMMRPRPAEQKTPRSMTSLSMIFNFGDRFLLFFHIRSFFALHVFSTPSAIMFLCFSTYCYNNVSSFCCVICCALPSPLLLKYTLFTPPFTVQKLLLLNFQVSALKNGFSDPILSHFASNILILFQCFLSVLFCDFHWQGQSSFQVQKFFT